jgi:hypothetical protein
MAWLGRVLTAWVFAIASVCASARAQNDPTALLTSATALQEASEHEAARVLLEQAYARAPSARVAGQLAISELALSRFREAEAHFTEALRAATDPWAIAHRDELVEGLGRAAAELGTIDTSRLEPGTEIFHGDETLGYAPAPIRWPAGSVELELESDEGSVAAIVTLAAGQTVVLDPPSFAPDTPAVTATSASARSTIAFPDSFRAAFARRGDPRPPLERTDWLVPDWATSTDLVIVARAGALFSPVDRVARSFTVDCKTEDLVLNPRLAIGAGVNVGIDLPLVLVMHGNLTLEPRSECEREDLVRDPLYDRVVHAREGWLAGLAVEASIRLTPGRVWYVGLGGELGVGVFFHEHQSLWQRSSDYPAPSFDGEVGATFLGRVFLEVGAYFGPEQTWSAGVRGGLGTPHLGSLEFELAIPLVGL